MHLHILSQDGLATLQLCARCGVAVHVAGVFASGLLLGGDMRHRVCGMAQVTALLETPQACSSAETPSRTKPRRRRSSIGTSAASRLYLGCISADLS